MELHFFSKIDNDMIQYRTKANLENNVLSYQESLNGKTSLVNLTITDKGIEILKNGETSTKMVFILSKTTTATYKTSFGSMDFEVFTKGLKITKEKIIIEYETIFDKKKVSDVKIWFIIKENA